MKLLKSLSVSLFAFSLLACSAGNGGPSDSVVETEVIKHIKPKVFASARDSLEVVKSACEPRREENVWRCAVTLQVEYEGKTEKDTMAYILTKANGAWFVDGPKPMSAAEREAFEGEG